MAKEAHKHSVALHCAVSANDVSTLRQLLAKGANPDTCYGDEFSLNAKSILHIACGKGYTDCVRVLLEAGAMADIRDKWGEMPLHYCLCSEFVDTAVALLNHAGNQAKAIVNSKLGIKNRTCLFTTAQRGFVDGMKLLIGYGADVNDMDYAGMTPLMACVGAGTGWIQFVTNDKVKIPTINCVPSDCGKKMIAAMNVLVEAGADLELKNHKGQTALQLAVQKVNVKALEYLVSVGADVNSVDFSGRTPLTNTIRICTKDGSLDGDAMSIVVMLTQASANMDSPTLESNALATCISAHTLSAPLLAFFLEQGANPDVFVAEETTPLLLAIRKKDMRSAATLLKYNCSLKTKGGIYLADSNPCTVDPMDVALRNQSFDFVRLLLLAGHEGWHSGSSSEILELMMQAYDDCVIDEESHQWFWYRLSSPPCLCELTVYKLRSLLGLHVHRVVPLLPVPSKVKDAILLTHLCD